jgi:dolichol-phosphate mannosyltransferase
MASVSLIVPISPGSAPYLERLGAFGRGLEAAGHVVEVLAVTDARCAELVEGLAPTVRALVDERPGKASSVFRGLREASGDFLVILDLEKGYEPDDLGRVLEPLACGDADVVVAATHRTSAHTDSLRWRLGTLLRPLIGITDPSSGLVAVTRASYEARSNHHTPLGARFVLELLVGSVGRLVEVPLRRSARPRTLVLGPSDLRLIKRLADDRFGNFSRLLQFCVVGASGMVIDLTCYALFQLWLSRTFLAGMQTQVLGLRQSLDLAVAGALAIAIALVWNFSLNRRLTFNDARQGSILRQFLTYLLGNALGIALSFSLRLILPSRIGFFRRHKLAAAVVGIVAATGISFSMSRWVVFTKRAAHRGQPHRSNPAALPERV